MLPRWTKDSASISLLSLEMIAVFEYVKFNLTTDILMVKEAFLDIGVDVDVDLSVINTVVDIFPVLIQRLANSLLYLRSEIS